MEHQSFDQGGLQARMIAALGAAANHAPTRQHLCDLVLGGTHVAIINGVVCTLVNSPAQLAVLHNVKPQAAVYDVPGLAIHPIAAAPLTPEQRALKRSQGELS